MKKRLINLLAFLRLVSKPKKNVNEWENNSQNSRLFEPEEPPKTEYRIYQDEILIAVRDNISQVCKTCSELKKSTLYRFFGKQREEGETSRTYRKNDYTVIECQKF